MSVDTAVPEPETPVENLTGGRRAMLLCALGFGLVALAGLLGPSVVAVTLPQREAWHPPYWFDVHPSPWLVVGLVFAALVCGAVGVHLGLRALAAGWQPRLRQLVGLGVGGVGAVALVPPMGSGDILMYAAYGRIAALGESPYVTAPADVSRTGYDPVASATELPWQEKTSVYGPIATWLQEAASRVAGESTHTTVMWLHLVNALAYVVVGLLVVVLAGRDPGARARAALLVLANPVLVWAVVAGAHNDAQAVMFAVAALVVARRSAFAAGRAFAAGVLVGLGGAVKLNVGLFGLALLWGMRRSKRSMAELCAGAALALVGTYGLVGPHAFDQIRAAGSYISTGTPWRLIFGPLHLLLLPIGVARAVIAVAALISIVLVAILLARALPMPVFPPAGPGDPTPDAVRAAAVLCLAWVLMTHYSLPWYDLVAWVPLALLAASPVDRLLLVRTAMMSAAYVSARVVVLPPTLDFLTTRLIDTVTPIVQAVVIVLLIRWCWQRGARLPSPFSSRDRVAARPE
ncbi:MAG TPA: polyprenol phosphomannose-dependent alpha 1,6 mannosyltransferase MptB [Cryptosporangiaceae bacterium]|nr:polyprenol phosphomannose-dependent alpha 1,6 mannosyltransferase MptB [Cryptosporangiaceae bacterium]